MPNWRTDFENMPSGRIICFYWADGGHDGFGGAICAMNFGYNDTEWASQPSHWAIIDPPGHPIDDKTCECGITGEGRCPVCLSLAR